MWKCFLSNLVLGEANCLSIDRHELIDFCSVVVSEVKKPSEELSSEEKRLAMMVMPGKKRKLYDKIMHGKKKKAAEVGKYF